MTRTRIVAAVAGLAVVGGGLWMHRRADAHEAPSYRYATVARGNLSSTVSATGTLGAVKTVQVGTQASGQLAAIYVDFNDHVKKGQLLARIDPTLQQQAVEDAQAQLTKAQAQLDQAQQEYDRNKPLFDQKFITASDFSTVQANLAVARANVKSAQVTLQRARQNLGYTSIYSPIDGVVVERDVDVGQTVAASFSAPQLFVIANDLSQMQILASVDESDIGQIKAGQPVSFTVQSYPDQTFTGTVQQVRLQSKTTDNVVNYTAVINVENRDGKLLPGMTATVEFQTASARDVLTVPNAALRFRATPEMLAQAGIKTDSTGRIQWSGQRRDSSAAASGAARSSASMSASMGGAAQAGAQRGTQAGARKRGSGAMLWYLDKTGALKVTRVRTGLSDGTNTEITGKDITDGMKIIVGSNQPAAASGSASAPAASPFGGAQRGGGMRRGGF